MTSPRSNLLFQEETEGGYIDTKPTSYYKRGNLLPSTGTSFRQKCTNGFRSRSSSYTSLEDDDDHTMTSRPSSRASFFSRKTIPNRSSTTLQHSFVTSPFEDDTKEDIEDSDEHTSFVDQKKKFSRQNLIKRPTSWKSSVLRAVGVKSK